MYWYKFTGFSEKPDASTFRMKLFCPLVFLRNVCQLKPHYTASHYARPCRHSNHRGNSLKSFIQSSRVLSSKVPVMFLCVFNSARVLKQTRFLPNPSLFIIHDGSHHTFDLKWYFRFKINNIRLKNQFFWMHEKQTSRTVPQTNTVLLQPLLQSLYGRPTQPLARKQHVVSCTRQCVMLPWTHLKRENLFLAKPR